MAVVNTSGTNGEGGQEERRTVQKCAEIVRDHLGGLPLWSHCVLPMFKATEHLAWGRQGTPTSSSCMRNIRWCICDRTQLAQTAGLTAKWTLRIWTRTLVCWKTLEAHCWTVQICLHHPHFTHVRWSNASRFPSSASIKRIACSISHQKTTWCKAKASCKGTSKNSVTLWHHVFRHLPQVTRLHHHYGGFWTVFHNLICRLQCDKTLFCLFVLWCITTGLFWGGEKGPK